MEKRKFDPLKTVSIVIIVVWELIIYFFFRSTYVSGSLGFFYQHDSVTLCGKFLPNKNSPIPHAPETKIVK